jgi:putative peptidoglycan lipid II flippase
MGAVLWLLALWLGTLFYTPGWRVAALAVLVTLGAASYFGIGHVIHAFRLSDFRSAMKR